LVLHLMDVLGDRLGRRGVPEAIAGDTLVRRIHRGDLSRHGHRLSLQVATVFCGALMLTWTHTWMLCKLVSLGPSYTLETVIGRIEAEIWLKCKFATWAHCFVANGGVSDAGARFTHYVILGLHFIPYVV
jgi:hypothetical protein